MFEKFSEITLPTLIALLALAVVGIGLLVAARRVRWNTRMLAYAALTIALSFILSYIRLYKMPQGGSITAGSMLPIMLFSFMFGPLPGLLTGAVYGLLQFMQEPYFVHPIQFLLEYPMAFGVIGLAGVMRNQLPANLQFLRMPSGALIAGVARCTMHVIAGAVFFAEYAPEGMNPWIYSLGYNGSFLSVDTAICIVIVCIPAVQALVRRNAISMQRSAA